MALTAETFQGMYPGIAASGPVLDAALAYGLEHVERSYGLAYDAARPVVVAHYHTLEFEAWPLTLSVLHPIERVVSLTVNDNPLDAREYAVFRNVGQMQIRAYFVWNTQAQLEYVPQDKNALRDAVQAELVLAYLSRSQQLLPAAARAEPPFFIDLSVTEGRITRRLMASAYAPNLPQYSEYKEVPGG